MEWVGDTGAVQNTAATTTTIRINGEYSIQAIFDIDEDTPTIPSIGGQIGNVPLMIATPDNFAEYTYKPVELGGGYHPGYPLVFDKFNLWGEIPVDNIRADRGEVFNFDMSLTESIREFSQEAGLNVNVAASYGFSTGSASLSYSSSLKEEFSQETRKVVMNVYLWNPWYSESIGNDDLILPETEVALAQNTPNEFIEKYGTHFIDTIHYGRYAVINYSFESKTRWNSTDIKSALSASINYLTASADASLESEQSTEELLSNTTRCAAPMAAHHTPWR